MPPMKQNLWVQVSPLQLVPEYFGASRLHHGHIHLKGKRGIPIIFLVPRVHLNHRLVLP